MGKETGERGPAFGGDVGGRPLEGGHAVVTGGGRGIGLAVADTLAGLGADVTVMGRDRDRLEEAAGRLSMHHAVRARPRVVDVADAEAVADGFAAAARDFGPATVLVNNAGIAPSAPFAATDPETWNRVLAVDLTGAYLCIRAALPAMLEAGTGRVVNIASTAGLKGYAYVSAYCAAKHGLVGLTRALALEVARTGVTVNAVCPGFTDTDLAAGSIATISAKSGRSEDEARAQLASLNPQGRLIAPQEVADAVAWLCLPASASINGQSIAVAGGEVM